MRRMSWMSRAAASSPNFKCSRPCSSDNMTCCCVRSGDVRRRSALGCCWCRLSQSALSCSACRSRLTVPRLRDASGEAMADAGRLLGREADEGCLLVPFGEAAGEWSATRLGVGLFSRRSSASSNGIRSARAEALGILAGVADCGASSGGLAAQCVAAVYRTWGPSTRPSPRVAQADALVRLWPAARPSCSDPSSSRVSAVDSCCDRSADRSACEAPLEAGPAGNEWLLVSVGGERARVPATCNRKA
jgi:hypothetical protein